MYTGICVYTCSLPITCGLTGQAQDRHKAMPQSLGRAIMNFHNKRRANAAKPPCSTSCERRCFFDCSGACSTPGQGLGDCEMLQSARWQRRRRARAPVSHRRGGLRAAPLCRHVWERRGSLPVPLPRGRTGEGRPKTLSPGIYKKKGSRSDEGRPGPPRKPPGGAGRAPGGNKNTINH